MTYFRLAPYLVVAALLACAVYGGLIGLGVVEWPGGTP